MRGGHRTGRARRTAGRAGIGALLLLAACVPLVIHRADPSGPADPSRLPSGAPAAGGSPADPSAAAMMPSYRPRPSAPPRTAAPRTPAVARVPALPPLRDRVAVGLSVSDSSAVELAADERLLGTHLSIASTYSDWTHVIGGPTERALAAGGTRTVLVSWEPWRVSFADVTSGREDAYLSAVARAMRGYPGTLYVRPWPEMNALWSTWRPGTASDPSGAGTSADFVHAWQYLVDYFRRAGVRNLAFVFDPDASMLTRNTPVPAIWPGAAYVDVLGMDGYNWGDSAPGPRDTGDRWTDFDAIFAPMYGTLTALDPTAPVWVTETGSKEPAVQDDSVFPAASSPVDPTHSKAVWVSRLFASTGFARMTAVVFFNVRKERDWRINSTPGALAALRQELSLRALRR